MEESFDEEKLKVESLLNNLKQEFNYGFEYHSLWVNGKSILRKHRLKTH